MKILATIILGLVFTTNLLGQDMLSEFVSQGIDLHDQGKYDQAIVKYKAALKIDKNSTLANYELSLTYFILQQYKNAIKYSAKIIKSNDDNQLEAYVLLGSSYDLLDKPVKAIKLFEQGLKKFPESNLLNYNFAVTLLNHKDYDRAENAAINAILANPEHGSSHIVLSETMKAKGGRVKSILPLYYFLMLEPNSKRSLVNYNSLKAQLGQGVTRKDEQNIDINISLSASDDEFGTADMMVSMLAASKFIEKNQGKGEMELFIEANRGLFNILGELKKENTGFWWDFYVTLFYDLVNSEHSEAFGYYISQSINSETVNQWMSENSERVGDFTYWMKNHE